MSVGKYYAVVPHPDGDGYAVVMNPSSDAPREATHKDKKWPTVPEAAAWAWQQESEYGVSIHPGLLPAFLAGK